VDIVRAGSNPAGCSAEHFGHACLRPAPVAQLSVLSVAGVMVSIVAFQAVDPGSIPGPRSLFMWGNTQHEHYVVCLLSLVVEHSLCKRKVGGSIPPVGCCVFCHRLQWIHGSFPTNKNYSYDIAEI
jgi:hypothetical protein